MKKSNRHGAGARSLLTRRTALDTEVYAGNNGKPEGIPIELADVIIRVLDYCGYAGIDIDAAISQKHEYNRTRPYRF